MSEYNILVAGSELADLNAIKQILEEKFNIFLATSGEGALAMMEENQIALIITDYDMSDTTGVELLAEIMQRHPNTVRVMLSPHIDEKLLMDAINKVRVYGLLRKPWKPEEIVSVVARGIEAYQTSRMPEYSADDDKKPLGELLIDHKIISRSQLDETIELLESGREQGELLIANEIISTDELEIALELQLAEALLSLGYAKKRDILFCFALRLGLDRKLLPRISGKPELSKIMPLKMAYRYSMVPVNMIGKALIVAVPKPLSNRDISGIERELKCSIIVKAA